MHTKKKTNAQSNFQGSPLNGCPILTTRRKNLPKWKALWIFWYRFYHQLNFSDNKHQLFSKIKIDVRAFGHLPFYSIVSTSWSWKSTPKRSPENWTSPWKCAYKYIWKKMVYIPSVHCPFSSDFGPLIQKIGKGIDTTSNKLMSYFTFLTHLLEKQESAQSTLPVLLTLQTGSFL